jgi:hypothetical protein
LHLVPFRTDFEYKAQKRKAQATSTWNQKQIAGADFETKDGFPHIFTWTVFDGTNYVDRHFLFGGTHDQPDLLLETNAGKQHPAFDLEILCNILKETGNPSQGGHGKRRQPQQFYFFNLGYDATAILKTLHPDAIDHLILGDAGIIDTHTWNLEPDARQISVPNPNYGKSKKKGQRKDKRRKIKVWVLGDEENYELLPFNRFIEVSYLPKKHLCLKPIKYYSKGVKWGKIDCWDIRPFCGGGSLNQNAQKHLQESKLDFTDDEMSLMGSLSPEGIEFSVKNCQKVIEYAELDANLTARLAWKIVHGFESNGVRMSRPYSPASVAERAALDRCQIPTMNSMIENGFGHVLAAWSAYQGGWFESNGVRYPYRPFIEHFYGNKLEQDMLKGTPEYDEEVRAINKLMINSIYGKTVQAIEKDGIRITGKLWNPFYAAVITAGCRSRMAEMIRINGQELILAVNTDGLIFKATDHLKVPENPMPVFFDGERVNLGRIRCFASDDEWSLFNH